jgi:hypothetical protein
LQPSKRAKAIILPGWLCQEAQPPLLLLLLLLPGWRRLYPLLPLQLLPPPAWFSWLAGPGRPLVQPAAPWPRARHPVGPTHTGDGHAQGQHRHVFVSLCVSCSAVTQP